MLALFARIYRHEEMIIARLVALAEYAPVMLEILLIIANLTTVSFPSYHSKHRFQHHHRVRTNQTARIQKMRDDGKDPYDIRKQEEVLQES